MTITNCYIGFLTRAPLGYSAIHARVGWGRARAGRFCPLSNFRSVGCKKARKTAFESSRQSQRVHNLCLSRSQVRSTWDQRSKLQLVPLLACPWSWRHRQRLFQRREPTLAKTTWKVNWAMSGYGAQLTSTWRCSLRTQLQVSSIRCSA